MVISRRQQSVDSIWRPWLESSFQTIRIQTLVVTTLLIDGSGSDGEGGSDDKSGYFLLLVTNDYSVIAYSLLIIAYFDYLWPIVR